MITNSRSSTETNLGDAVLTAYDLGRVVAADGTTTSDLAARRLERMLVRGSNARLIAALTSLAHELRPTRSIEELPFREAPAAAALAR